MAAICEATRVSRGLRRRAVLLGANKPRATRANLPTLYISEAYVNSRRTVRGRSRVSPSCVTALAVHELPRSGKRRAAFLLE